MALPYRFIGATFALVLCAPTFAAERTATTEEQVGVGAGVVIGAVAGGPVGAILGGALGAMLGDAYHVRGERAADLTRDLEAERKVTTRLAAENRGLDREIDRLRSTARPELVSLLRAGIEMDLLFRTDEFVLTTATDARLKSLASTLAALPDVQVRIDGYSDERGDAAYNFELSKKRAGYVRDALIAAGFPAARIRVNAHGESPAAEATVDSFALERRVSMTVFVDDPEAVAAMPNE